MTEQDEEHGFWRGSMESQQKEILRRLARVETFLLGIISALAAFGLKALGIWPL